MKDEQQMNRSGQMNQIEWRMGEQMRWAGGSIAPAAAFVAPGCFASGNSSSSHDGKQMDVGATSWRANKNSSLANSPSPARLAACGLRVRARRAQIAGSRTRSAAITGSGGGSSADDSIQLDSITSQAHELVDGRA